MARLRRHLGRWDKTEILTPCTAFFCTSIHKFAQTSPPISIDAPQRNEYLPRQIEPESLKTLRSA